MGKWTSCEKKRRPEKRRPKKPRVTERRRQRGARRARGGAGSRSGLDKLIEGTLAVARRRHAYMECTESQNWRRGDGDKKDDAASDG